MRGTKPKSRSAPTTVLVAAINEVNGPAQQLPTGLQGELLKRRYKRRVDLRSLPGALRESARVYRDLCDGAISLETAEVRSRVIGRHREILAHLEQQKELRNLLAELKAVREGSGTAYLQNLVDDDV